MSRQIGTQPHPRCGVPLFARSRAIRVSLDCGRFAEKASHALAARKEAWMEAYEHTPYGEPVELLHSSD
jgi:hypothetical protein